MRLPHQKNSQAGEVAEALAALYHEPASNGASAETEMMHLHQNSMRCAVEVLLEDTGPQLPGQPKLLSAAAHETENSNPDRAGPIVLNTSTAAQRDSQIQPDGAADYSTAKPCTGSLQEHVVATTLLPQPISCKADKVAAHPSEPTADQQMLGMQVIVQHNQQRQSKSPSCPSSSLLLGNNSDKRLPEGGKQSAGDVQTPKARLAAQGTSSVLGFIRGIRTPSTSMWQEMQRLEHGSPTPQTRSSAPHDVEVRTALLASAQALPRFGSLGVQPPSDEPMQSALSDKARPALEEPAGHIQSASSDWQALHEAGAAEARDITIELPTALFATPHPPQAVECTGERRTPVARGLPMIACTPGHKHNVQAGLPRQLPVEDVGAVKPLRPHAEDTRQEAAVLTSATKALECHLKCGLQVGHCQLHCTHAWPYDSPSSCFAPM